MIKKIIILFILLFALFVKNNDVFSAGSCSYIASACKLCGISPNTLGTDGAGNECPIPDYTFTDQTGYCFGECHYNPDTNDYTYVNYYSMATLEGGTCDSDTETWNILHADHKLDTSINGCFWPDVPVGCNVGRECVGGGGGECGGRGSTDPNSSCPTQFQDVQCQSIPCAERLNCMCDCNCNGCSFNPARQVCDNDLLGGGGLPTPTPTPYCSLVCPGGETQAGGIDSLDPLNGGPGVIDPDGKTPPVMSVPVVTGYINYFGYNGFACGSFNDGKNYVPCPDSSLGGTGQNGLSETWQYPTNTPIKYNMLCGQQPWTYTSVVNKSTVGNMEIPTPTQMPEPINPKYPPGCFIVLTPTPTGDRPTPFETPGDANEVPIGGGDTDIGGAASGTNACSCSVILQCQEIIQSPPSALGTIGCTPGVCDFTVSPECPIYGNTVTFTADTLEDNVSYDFDDYSSPSTEKTSGHTFPNAGVYDVSLTCGGMPDPCTRTVNVYCDNNVCPQPLPTATPTTGPWYKLKNASFTRKTDIINRIPETPIGYDSNDTYCHEIEQLDYRCLLSGEAGVSQSTGTIDTNGAPISHVGWSKSDAVIPSSISLSDYIAYIKAKKQYEEVTKADIIDNFVANETLTTDKVYVYNDVDNPTLTITSSTFTNQTEPFVLVVEGDTQIESAPTSLETASATFIITGELRIATEVSALHGIFITNTLDFSYNPPEVPIPNPLKITGNIISYTQADTTKRASADIDKPSIFVVFDIQKYLDLWPLLTIKTSPQQEEIQ